MLLQFNPASRACIPNPVRTSHSKPIAWGRGRLVELFCILASIYPPSFTLLHMQDYDVSAEWKRVTSGATAEDEVIVIKNLAKVCMYMYVICRSPWLERVAPG